MKQNKCGKDNKKLEPLFTVGANVQLLWKTDGGASDN